MSLANTLYRRPWILAIGIVFIILIWMVTGEQPPESNANAVAINDVKGEQTLENSKAAQLIKKQKTKVRVRLSEAEQVNRVIDLHGKTEAARQSTITAETNGRVESILVSRGSFVKKGALLIELDLQDRDAKLAQAKAEMRQRQLEFDGAKKLGQKGYNAQTLLAEAESKLENAKANLASLQLDIGYTKIIAPFDGVFNDRTIEIGDYVSRGMEIGTFLDLSTIIVRGNVPEKNIGEVHIGQQGTASLVNQQIHSGQVRYVSRQSSDATHTFRVELEIPNPELTIPVGISSSIQLISQQMMAHKVSPAILSLSASGDLGVKVIAADNLVVFKPVSIIKSDFDGVWLSGLSSVENIIIMGQGFVKQGEEVDSDVVNKSPTTSEIDASLKAVISSNKAARS
jgi:membrane fusion protein, multidrug efflux system